MVLVSYPARWSFSFIVGSLHWSSISNIQRIQKYSAVMYYVTPCLTPYSHQPNLGVPFWPYCWSKMKSFSATLNLEARQLPKHYLGNALPFSANPSGKQAFGLMPGLGWMIVEHIYIFMRALALTTTILDLLWIWTSCSCKEYFVRMIWINSTCNCARGDAWLIFALCDVYAFHFKLFEHPLSLFVQW